METVDPPPCVGATPLSAPAHGLVRQPVEALAVSRRVALSLEDLLGGGAGRVFWQALESFWAGRAMARRAEVVPSYAP